MKQAGAHVGPAAPGTFSILERIDVGETRDMTEFETETAYLSVSSNGSTWVKLAHINAQPLNTLDFQYPRTDRRG